MFDLATAKTRLNITDTTQDVQLQAALDAALAIAEGYCDRYFMHAPAQVEKRTHVAGSSVSLMRYPLDAEPTLSGDSPNYKFHTDWDNGVIHFDGNYVDHKLTINYSGGYVTLPADLEYAFWGIFNGVWSNMNDVASAGVGGVGQVGITGVGYIRFMADESNSGSKGDPISGYVEAILANYKRYKT